MIKRFRSLEPVPEIFILIPPPLYDPYPFDMNQTIINSIFPTLLPDIGAVAQVTVIDVFSAFVDSGLSSTELSCDGCHPTAEGNKIIAQAIFNMIVENKKS